MYNGYKIESFICPSVFYSDSSISGIIRRI
jgi:hypothetical protein